MYFHTSCDLSSFSVSSLLLHLIGSWHTSCAFAKVKCSFVCEWSISVHSLIVVWAHLVAMETLSSILFQSSLKLSTCKNTKPTKLKYNCLSSFLCEIDFELLKDLNNRYVYEIIQGCLFQSIIETTCAIGSKNQLNRISGSYQNGRQNILL